MRLHLEDPAADEEAMLLAVRASTRSWPGFSVVSSGA